MLILAVLALIPAAHADEKPIDLKQASGLEAVENNCAACHSLDYIRTNSPFLDHKGWQAEVTKMIAVFGAPIRPAEAQTIVDYLTRNYGVGS
jgi:mono/diheme cytochrome c family protein